MSLELLQQIERRPNLVALIPLEPGGELDLRRVRNAWGLDTCAVGVHLLSTTAMLNIHL